MFEHIYLVEEGGILKGGFGFGVTGLLRIVLVLYLPLEKRSSSKLMLEQIQFNLNCVSITVHGITL